MYNSSYIVYELLCFVPIRYSILSCRYIRILHMLNNGCIIHVSYTYIVFLLEGHVQCFMPKSLFVSHQNRWYTNYMSTISALFFADMYTSITQIRSTTPFEHTTNPFAHPIQTHPFVVVVGVSPSFLYGPSTPLQLENILPPFRRRDKCKATHGLRIIVPKHEKFMPYSLGPIVMPTAQLAADPCYTWDRAGMLDLGQNGP